jgi:23S rRNA pseudouridine1911/1915/1917 synthase
LKDNITKKYKIEKEDEGKRLDNYLSELPEINLSRSYIQELIKKELITVDDKKSKASLKLKLGQTIHLTIPEAEELKIEAENIPLNIVYEDEDLILIDKPINMSTHPAPGLYSGTLVNAVLYHSENLSSINGVIRPGIVHRLDKDTSGLILVAKNDQSHRSLSEQIQSHSMDRHYLSLVHENIKSDKGIIRKAIGRHPKYRERMQVYDSMIKASVRMAITHWKVLKRYRFKEKNFSLVECKLETGRTHQIRVHMSWFKHPVVGDFIYGAPRKTSFNVLRPLLHSYKIRFKHPRTEKPMGFEISLPEDFSNIISLLEF